MTGLKSELMARVDQDLKDIEEALRQGLTPHLDMVHEVAGHLIFSGGKRIRPLLNILTARLCGYTDPFIKRFSTIIEFLHTATLLHDDVVDAGSMRRGKPAAHLVYGAPVTVLVGDFLLARALTIAAETKSPKIISVISTITESMCQGEIRQLVKKGDASLSEAEYMDLITRKTGFLISGACQTGAILAGAEDAVENRLAAFGLHVGLAFQIADDLLDYTAKTQVLGKRIGADLKEGKLTLPVIYALAHASPKDRDWIKQLITKKDFSHDAFNRLVSLLHDYGGIPYAVQVAGEHVKKAKDILGGFEPSRTRDTLLMIADYSLSRTS